MTGPIETPGFLRCLIFFVTSVHLNHCRCYAGKLATFAPCCNLASCSRGILNHSWSKLFYFYPMHIEQPPRGPGCMMVPKSLPFCIVLPLMCQKGSRTILQIDANFAVTSFGGFLNWGNPQVSSILMGLSLTKTIQLLGYPHSQETSICGRSPPRILAAHHRASTSPSGGS